MKKIKFLTIFPEMFDGWKSNSIIKRAIESKKVAVEIIDFRNWATNKHRTVDDTPYGGGPGMVLSVQPIADCIKEIRTKDSHVILLSPQSKPYDQSKAKKLSSHKELIFICGHYEGIDERILNYVDEVISLGNFVTTGGEVCGMVIADSIIRLYDGVIKSESLIHETHNSELVDYPTYTKPISYDHHEVPEVLRSGNHQAIQKWRKEQQVIKTKKIKGGKYEK